MNLWDRWVWHFKFWHKSVNPGGFSVCGDSSMGASGKASLHVLELCSISRFCLSMVDSCGKAGW